MSRPQSPSAVPLPPGRGFGPYVLVRKLAEGGMAEVFLAKLPGASGFERNVVIKRMLRHLSALPDFVDMFQHEAKLAARLAHPNIIHIEELGFVDGYYFICMEYLAGEDFSTVLRRAAQSAGYVPLSVALRVLVDAAHGLHHAHEFCDELGRPLGVVHRDVSPSNLFLTYQGQVKVLDFGIAKAGSRITQTSTGVVKGKYSYMAPEQARGDEVDRRADIFALGVSLYEALTQVRPFARDHELAVLNAVLSASVVPPSQLRPDLPPALERIVLRALAAEPERRYPTAAALAEDLEAFAQAHAALASGAQVAAYLRASFGEEHLARRSRVPTLASVLDASADGEDTALELPGAAGAGHRGATAVLPAEVERATAARTLASGRARVTPVHAPAEPPRDAARPPVRRWSAVLLGALAGGLLVAGAALTLAPRLRQAPEEAARPDAAPVATAPAAGPAPLAAVPSAQPAPQQAAPPAAPAEAQPAVVVAAAPAPAPAAPLRAARVRPVELDAAVIQRVVSRGRAGIEACFERHKEDLSADAGEVRVRFDILRTGRVEAHTQGPLAATAVGRCLEAQVSRLRFPAHRDEKVTAEQPFAYRVTR